MDKRELPIQANDCCHNERNKEKCNLTESHVNTESLFKMQRLIRGKVVYCIERMANM